MPLLSFDTRGSYVQPKPSRYTLSDIGRVNAQLNRTQGYEGVVPKATKRAAPKPAPSPVRYSGGSGGGGGGGAGGGGSTASPAPAPPPKTLDRFQLDEIEAALSAISARYDYERQGLSNQQSAIGRAFELLMDQMDEDEKRALFENKARSGGSGRIRSGLFLKDQARIDDAFADQAVRARAERDSKLSPIQQALGSLAARRDAERAAEARAIAREMLGTQEAIAQALELV